MDWLMKAALTAASVLLVMVASQRCNPRVAGLIAALPTITAPTLAWLAQEQGLDFAVAAAIGSVAACAMLAVFALIYATVSRRAGIGKALVCGAVGAVAMALPAVVASARLADAVALALGSSALAFGAMGGAGAPTASRRHSRRALGCFALAAGGLSALATTLGPVLGGFATGVLASLPLISGAVAVSEHVAGGAAAATRFLRGYVFGLFGKAAFGAVFALLASRLGAPAALALGCICAGVMATGQWPKWLRNDGSWE